jgi:tetratricopeptide (TPR) repeat protein
MMADRYAYFSLMGFALALAYFICKTPTKVVVVLVALICLVYSAIDIKRNAIWKDDQSFFTQMIKDEPEMSIGYNGLGFYYYKKQDLASAEKYLTIASTKKGTTPRTLGAGAGIFWQANKLDTAEKLLLRQLELEPNDPQPYIMLKMIYAKRGDKAKAASYGDKVSAKFPGIEESMKQRVVDVTRQAESFMAMRSFERAETLIREALIINPDFVPAIVDMGNISAEKDDAASAVKYFTQAIALEPFNTQAHYNLAQVYERQGKTAEAEMEKKKYIEAEERSNKQAAPEIK